MLDYIYHTLSTFRKVFRRNSTWLQFCAIILGFIGAYQIDGVSSFCCFWHLQTPGYHALLHLFRSSAWALDELLRHWETFVLAQNQAVQVDDRLVLLGDHTNVSKDGRRMPGVVTIHQDSETQSKPSYFRGHFWGSLFLLIGTRAEAFAVPLGSRLHQGFTHLLKGNDEKSGCAKRNDNQISEPSAPEDNQKSKQNAIQKNKKTTKVAESSATRLVQMAIDFSRYHQRHCFLVLDAFFSIAPVFKLAASALSERGEAIISIITRAKKNYVAWFPVEESTQRKPGRPQKYGKKVHIYNVFDEKDSFQKTSCQIYGKTEIVLHHDLNLFWKPTGDFIRFIFAITSRGPIVLMCSDLKLQAVTAIELYCARVRAETVFAALKNLMGVFRYHFWTKRLPRHSRKPKKNTELKSPTEKDLHTVQKCWDCYERFVALGSIALGLLQLIALKYPDLVWSQFHSFIRTCSRHIPSERTVKTVVAQMLIEDFLKVASSATMHKIKDYFSRQKMTTHNPLLPEEKRGHPIDAGDNWGLDYKFDEIFDDVGFIPDFSSLIPSPKALVQAVHGKFVRLLKAVYPG
jgi:hypothetical protein